LSGPIAQVQNVVCQEIGIVKFSNHQNVRRFTANKIGKKDFETKSASSQLSTLLLLNLG
jgi:hypothetical protein